MHWSINCQIVFLLTSVHFRICTLFQFYLSGRVVLYFLYCTFTKVQGVNTLAPWISTMQRNWVYSGGLQLRNSNEWLPGLTLCLECASYFERRVSREASLLRGCARIWCWKQRKIDQRPACRRGWLRIADCIQLTNWSCYIAIRMFQDVCNQWMSLAAAACRTLAVTELQHVNEGTGRKEYVSVCQALSFIRLWGHGEKEEGEEYSRMMLI